jgi:hypothetical protein
MEVHHHPEVKHQNKNFKEYFLEFLMIFLAVTMGFIAENLRERIADRNKEREYIESMVQDLKTDTTEATNIITAITSQIYGMDTLEMLLTPNVNKNDSDVFICYRLQVALHNQHVMNFSNRTITQLVSSGNMRLIKNPSISDSITEYYSNISKVDAQKGYYIEYFHKCLEIYQQIYEFESYHSTLDAKGDMVFPPIVYGKYHIAETGEDELKKYKSTIETTKEIVSSYSEDIKNSKQQAVSLCAFLKKEYKIHDN